MTDTNQAANTAAGTMTPLDLAKEIRPLLTQAEPVSYTHLTLPTIYSV